MRQRIAAWFVDALVPLLFPRVNPMFRWLLNSRLHWLASWYVVLLLVPGRRSGRLHEIPIAYHADGTGAFEALTSPHGRWWKNLRGLPELEVVIRGQRRLAHIELIENDSEAKEAALGRRDLCRRILTPLPPEHTILIRFRLVLG